MNHSDVSGEEKLEKGAFPASGPCSGSLSVTRASWCPLSFIKQVEQVEWRYQLLASQGVPLLP